ncbi:MAG: PQQ-binding-like beta-propeller repeat protein [Candidatus Brocadiia bacterium]
MHIAEPLRPRLRARRRWALALVLCLAGLAGAGERPGARARRILAAARVRGGLIVRLGCADGRLAAALGAESGAIVHGLDADPANVQRARATARAAGLGGRVTASAWDGRHLPYADNLVSLVVAEDLGETPMAEVMRVLCPGGVAALRREGAWTRTVKPRPPELDEWTHSLHEPSNNAVGRDRAVGPPRRIQWVGVPRRARQHERLASVSAVVSAGGRVFSIQDEGPVASVLLPPRWFLVARDAFNGAILWRRPIGPWEEHLRPFRSGPPDLSRRLVALGDRVYVTLGTGKPLSALDAATGETLHTYEGTEGTREVLCTGERLFLVARSAGGDAAARRGGADASSTRILALRAPTGERLWEKRDADTARLMPVTLAVAADRVFFQNAQAVVCLDAGTGEALWRAARPVAPKRPAWSAPTLVVHDGVVLSADRAAPGKLDEEPGRKHKAGWIDAPVGRLVAFAADSGEELWSCPCREGFHAAVDVLVADGLVWTGELAHANDPGITAGRDLLTGAVERRRPADQAFFQVGMPHHRCHRNRATDRYLVLGRAGVEFIDVATGRGIPHHWVRGTCQFGVVPCNGLLYAPPHACACYSRAKINGFYALAPSPRSQAPGSGARGERLEKGPAYGGDPPPGTRDPEPGEWPTYRHDRARSGCTPAAVPAELGRLWEAALGGKLSSVVVAEGTVLVAEVDAHTVHALDARDGTPRWRYTAGGRVDSPPTVHQGLALFGSADGYVTCLRLADGQVAWRFRAAPQDRRVVAYGQVESTWPVHGSVLVADGAVAFAAGRSSYLDGGIFLHRLDPRTGDQLSCTRLDSRAGETRRQPKGAVRGFDLPGALPDILSSDGSSLYMRHARFDLAGRRQEEGARHLFSPTGFLDDTWWHRSYWVFGQRFYTGYRDWFRAGRQVPAGRLLVVDGQRVYGFGRKPEYYYWSTPLEYHLFAAAKEPELVESPRRRRRVPRWGQLQVRTRWTADVPLLVRAMVLAGDTLFVAGPPDLVDEREAWRRRQDPAMREKLEAQAAALEGRKGARLWAVAASDGSKLAELSLASPPVFDGMAAAAGRLYMATLDGAVVCLGGAGQGAGAP